MEIFLGIGATISGTLMLSDPFGSEALPLYMLDNTPFTNFVIPGLILFSLLGVYPLVVAYCLWRLLGWRWPDAINPWKQRHWSWAAALSTGIIVLIWITVQMLMLPRLLLPAWRLHHHRSGDPAAGADRQREGGIPRGKPFSRVHFPKIGYTIRVG